MNTTILLDNSALSTLSCRRKFQLTVLKGLTLPIQPAHLVFGSAFHTAIEHLDKGLSIPEALGKAAPALNSTQLKDLANLLILATSQVTLPPSIELDGIKAIEYKFKFLFGDFMQSDGTSIKVYLAGTVDKIYLDDNILVIRDYKTAADGSKYSIEKKLQDYELALQLHFYAYSLLQLPSFPEEYKDFLREGKYRLEYIFAFYNAAPIVFKRKLVAGFSQDFLTREIPMIITNKVMDALNVSKLTSSAPHDGMCVYKACSYCDFRNACLVSGTAREDELLFRFDIREYNPLTFR